MTSKSKLNKGMGLLAIILVALLCSCQAKERQIQLSPSIPPSTTPYLPTPDTKTSEPDTPLPSSPTRKVITHTSTPKPTATLTQTVTPTIPIEATAFSSVGTSLPVNPPAIDAENIDFLRNVAQWRGTILSAAFAPDGESFVVGSAYGIAIYNYQDLDRPPEWIPFREPFFYQNMVFSTDSSYILLEGYEGDQTFTYPDILPTIDSPESGWQWTTDFGESGYLDLDSPSDAIRLRSTTTYDEIVMDIQYSHREMIDNETDEILYILKDDTIQITFDARHEPEGCDLSSFSFCGNAYLPIASLPYLAGFSPSEETLAILYRPPGLWNSNRYSTLRLYRVEDGGFIQAFGSMDDPIETFAFPSDGEALLLGHVDGTVQLWDISIGQTLYSSRDFLTPYSYISFSHDGDFVFLRSKNAVEVRSTRNGLVRGRYESRAFALHPIKPHFATADEEGNVKIQDIRTGATLWMAKVHNDKVLSLAFSTDGRYLASSGQDCRIKLWDATSGEFLHYFERTIVNAYGEPGTDSRIFIYFFEFIPDTDRVIGFGSWGTVVNWSINSGASHYVIYPEPLEYYQGMITLNPHFPEYFGLDFENGLIYLNDRSYDISTGERVGEYTSPGTLPDDCAHPGLTPIETSIVFSRGYDAREGEVCVLSSQDLSLIQTIEVIPSDHASYAWIDWVYLSPDETQLLVTTINGPIYVFQVDG